MIYVEQFKGHALRVTGISSQNLSCTHGLLSNSPWPREDNNFIMCGCVMH